MDPKHRDREAELRSEKFKITAGALKGYTAAVDSTGTFLASLPAGQEYTNAHVDDLVRRVRAVKTAYVDAVKVCVRDFPPQAAFAEFLVVELGNRCFSSWAFILEQVLKANVDLGEVKEWAESTSIAFSNFMRLLPIFTQENESARQLWAPAQTLVDSIHHCSRIGSWIVRALETIEKPDARECSQLMAELSKVFTNIQGQPEELPFTQSPKMFLTESRFMAPGGPVMTSFQAGVDADAERVRY